MDKELEALKRMKENSYYVDDKNMEEDVNVLEQALTEKQDLEKFTRLVIVKSFNFDRFNYVLRHWDADEQLGVYNYGIGNVYKYTKEEFNFLKEMIVKYGKRN